jgi:hypothetical protein
MESGPVAASQSPKFVVPHAGPVTGPRGFAHLAIVRQFGRGGKKYE